MDLTESGIPVPFINILIQDSSIRTRIRNLFRISQGCPSCNGRLPWTRDRFLSRAYELNKDKHNYSLIIDVKSIKSKINIICNLCGYGIDGDWITSVQSYIDGHGCPRVPVEEALPVLPSCARNIPWNLTRLLKAAYRVHKNKYNYALVNKEHIQGQESKIPIICNTCMYGANSEWNISINHHINSGTGCPNCSGYLRWTRERFLEQAHKVHSNKYNYSLVTEDAVISSQSRIPLICNICQYGIDGCWTPLLYSHIAGTGCPNCAGNAPWTLEKFLLTARTIHKDNYNYSYITNSDINGSSSKIPIICNICYYSWTPTISSHINNRSGCPHCKMSKGELSISNYLVNMKIHYEIEYAIPGFPLRCVGSLLPTNLNFTT